LENELGEREHRESINVYCWKILLSTIESPSVNGILEDETATMLRLFSVPLLLKMQFPWTTGDWTRCP
jgi:hypothetical protein